MSLALSLLSRTVGKWVTSTLVETTECWVDTTQGKNKEAFSYHLSYLSTKDQGLELELLAQKLGDISRHSESLFNVSLGIGGYFFV